MALTKMGPAANFPVNTGVCVDVGGRKIAVFNATGVRIQKLPITAEKIRGGLACRLAT